MKLLKLSSVLILLAWALALNAPSLRANGSESLKPTKSSPPLPVPTIKQIVSEPPTPRIKQENEPKEKGEKDKQISNSLSAPPIVIGQPASNSEKDPATNKPQYSFADGFAPPTWANWAQVIVAAFGLFFIWLTIRAMRDQVKVGQDTATAALKEAESITTSERAYVKMSHLQPGLQFNEPDAMCWAWIQVKNYGQTPARITAIVMGSRYFLNDEALPVRPPYELESGNYGRGFLVANEEFFFMYSRSFGYSVIQSRQGRFLIYGYVDYIDQFGQRHRAGYARQYDPDKDRRSDYKTAEDYDR